MVARESMITVVASQEPSIGEAVVAKVTVSMHNRRLNMGHNRDVRDKTAVVGVWGGHAGVVVGVSVSLGISLSISVSNGVSLTLMFAKIDEGFYRMMDNGRHVMWVVNNWGVMKDRVGDNFMCDLSRNLHNRFDDCVVDYRVSHREDGCGV